MFGERTTEGWQVRLRPQGNAQYLAVAFLLFWLCGWAVGEVFAGSFLVKGVLAMMNGAPFDGGKDPLQAGPAVAMGGFLLLWLSLWTLGGLAAIAQVLQLLWAEDRLIAHAAGITILRSRGPFRGRREIPRDALRRLILVPRSDALAAETPKGRAELSRLGTRAEREEAAAALRAELGLSEGPSEPATAALPKGWEEVLTTDGARAMAVSAAIRRNQSRVVGVLALLVACVAFGVFQQAARELPLLPVAILASLGALGLTWGAVHLARTRTVWRVGNGFVTLRRSTGPSWEDLFEARRLELVVSTDSDGDEWFHLEALKGSADTPEPQHWSQGNPRNRRRIASAMNESTVPRQLGQWLARTAGIPLEDRTTPAAREAELSQLRAQLEKSGRFGRMAVRLLDGAIERPRKSA